MKIAILSDIEIQEFRKQILQDLIDFFSIEIPAENRWIKTAEVKKILGCSVTTIHNYKNAGILSYTKIGGTIYYDKEGVLDLLNSKRNFGRTRRNTKQAEGSTIVGYEVS